MSLSWEKLVRLSDPELARLDIAEVNLACAAGLPGAERIDVGHCLSALDSWAETVRRYTALAYEQFFLPNPAEYDHSEPLFRMASSVNALQRHCGIAPAAGSLCSILERPIAM